MITKERKREIALKNLEKAKAKGYNKGAKHKTTLLRENWEREARDNYLGQVSPFLAKIAKAQLKKAIKEGDVNTQQYIINQAIGRPLTRQETDLTTKGKPIGSIVLPQRNEEYKQNEVSNL